jgi:hypothetical protein
MAAAALSRAQFFLATYDPNVGFYPQLTPARGKS